jgi:hypothetical protein
MEWKFADWIGLAKNKNKWRRACEHGDQYAGYTKCGAGNCSSSWVTVTNKVLLSGVSKLVS